MVKKYIGLLLTMAFTVFAVYTVPKLVFQSVPVVTVAYPDYTSISTSINVNGRVEEGRKKEVLLPVSAQIDRIACSVGERVNSGDPLLDYYAAEAAEQAPTADVTAYSDVLSQYGIQSPKQSAPQPSRFADDLTTLNAPMSGMITKLQVQEGAFVGAMSCAMTISDLSVLNVICSVGENQIVNILPGQQATITGKGFQGKNYRGTVATIAPVATQNLTGGLTETTVEVTIAVKNPDEKMKPGFSAEVKIDIANKDNALLIPFDTISQDENNREYIHVYQGGIARKVLIETGAELEDCVEVVTGIMPNELIVIKSNHILRDAEKVFLNKGGK